MGIPLGLGIVVEDELSEHHLCICYAQWNQIDAATGLTGTHSDLSALTKEHTQVFTLSMWDIRRKFRFVMISLVIYDIMMT